MGRLGWHSVAPLGLERSISPQCHGDTISREAFSRDFSEGINWGPPVGTALEAIYSFLKSANMMKLLLAVFLSLTTLVSAHCEGFSVQS